MIDRFRHLVAPLPGSRVEEHDLGVARRALGRSALAIAHLGVQPRIQQS